MLPSFRLLTMKSETAGHSWPDVSVPIGFDATTDRSLVLLYSPFSISGVNGLSQISYCWSESIWVFIGGRK